MEKSFRQQPTLPVFELKETIIVWKVCLALITLSTIVSALFSLIGKYDYLLWSILSYIGGGVPLYLLRQKRLNTAKLWLLIVPTIFIILSPFLVGTASYASFIIIPVPFAAMVFYHEKQYLWHCLLLAIIGFLLCEGIVLYTYPIWEVSFPLINKFIAALAIILVTYFLLDSFKTVLLKKEATLLAQNALLKKEIEERKRVEATLMEKEARLKLAIETAQLGVRDINLPTGETFLGEQWCHFLEYEKELFFNGEMQLLYLIHEEDKAYVQTLIQDQLDGKISAYEVAFRVYTKSNKIKWVQQLSKTISIDKEGKPRRIIEIYMDITAQLTINIDLEKKNKKLRELSSVASYYMQAYIRRN